LHEKFLAALPAPCQSQMVDTSYGSTRVLTAGPAGGAPLVLLSGIHVGAARTLLLLYPLAVSHRVYALDTIGQPGWSAQTRPPRQGHHYGHWVAQAMDGLGLETASFLSMSFGASVLMDTAVYAPERIARAVLVTPAGVITPNILSLALKLALPWTLHRLWPCRALLLSTIKRLAAEPEPQLLELFDATIRHVKWWVMPPGPFHKEQLARFTAPTLLIMAQEDFFFPQQRLAPAARRVLPNLAAVETLEGRHIPSRQGLERICSLAEQFLRNPKKMPKLSP